MELRGGSGKGETTAGYHFCFEGVVFLCFFLWQGEVCSLGFSGEEGSQDVDPHAQRPAFPGSDSFEGGEIRLYVVIDCHFGEQVSGIMGGIGEKGCHSWCQLMEQQEFLGHLV